MRTNIDIDDELMSTILESGLYHTKKDAVEAGLTLLKHKIAQLELIKMRGMVTFFDDNVYASHKSYLNSSKVSEGQDS
jgi:Arc/MetJ family transcription regulator